MNTIWKFFVRLQNPLMNWLLRSPLHGAASGMYMLISITGRKTGAVYTTPVQYKQQEETLWVITSTAYQWWRNLQGGADVQLNLRGVPRQATAHVSADPAQIREVLCLLYPAMSAAQTQSFVGKSLAVRIRLDKSSYSSIFLYIRNYIYAQIRPARLPQLYAYDGL